MKHHKKKLKLQYSSQLTKQQQLQNQQQQYIYIHYLQRTIFTIYKEQSKNQEKRKKNRKVTIYKEQSKKQEKRKNRKVNISVPLCRDHKIFAVEDHGTEAMALQKKILRTMV